MIQQRVIEQVVNVQVQSVVDTTGMFHPKILKKTMQRKKSTVRVKDQAYDKARRPHSKGGTAKINKINVQRKESIWRKPII